MPCSSAPGLFHVDAMPCSPTGGLCGCQEHMGHFVVQKEPHRAANGKHVRPAHAPGQQLIDDLLGCLQSCEK